MIAEIQRWIYGIFFVAVIVFLLYIYFAMGNEKDKEE